MISSSTKLSFKAWLAPLAALALLTIYFGAERFTLGEIGYPLDDTYIHLQFARSLAAGHGMSYNPGELSTGSTSPLWTALLSLGFLVPGFELLWPKLLGTLGLITTVWGSRRLLQALGAEPLYQQSGALLVAATPWLLWSALSGMEILLFTSLILWTLVWVAEEDAGHGAPLLAALAALARPEGLLLLALVLLARQLEPVAATGAGTDGTAGADGTPPGLRLKRHGGFWQASLPAALLVLPPLAVNAWISGSIWPSTLAAKTVPDGDWLPDARYLRTALTVLWDGQGLLLLLAGAGALLLLKRLRPSSLLPALFCFGLPLAYSLIASEQAPAPVGNFGRYLFPLLPLVVVLALLGLENGLSPLRRGLALGRFKVPVVGILLVALVLMQGFLAVQGVARYAQTLKNVADSDVAAARFLATRLPAEASIAAQDIGALKFFLPNSILDLTGIVTPKILPTLRAQDGVYWEERLHHYLAAEKADLVVVFSASYPALTSGRIAGYQRLASFKVERNVTMAGDELVILQTPWCRFPVAAGSPPSSPF